MARSATFSAQPDAAVLLAQATCETGPRDFGNRARSGTARAISGCRRRDRSTALRKQARRDASGALGEVEDA
jgi:hypothetical protein